MEMENGGIDVEHFLFNSANQSLYAFLQVCDYYNMNHLLINFVLPSTTCQLFLMIIN